jgi:hypothetical protein
VESILKNFLMDSMRDPRKGIAKKEPTLFDLSNWEVQLTEMRRLWEELVAGRGRESVYLGKQ